MTPNSETTLEMTEVVSEHQRILKLEHEDIPTLKRDLAEVVETVEKLRDTQVEDDDTVVTVPLDLFGGIGVIAAASGIPLIYTTAKTYGAGGKQVAQHNFAPAGDLKAKKVGTCVEYTAKPTKTVTLTITHADGTVQTHPIVPPAPAPAAGQTTKVTICFDPKTGAPSSIYIK